MSQMSKTVIKGRGLMIAHLLVWFHQKKTKKKQLKTEANCSKSGLQ